MDHPSLNPHEDYQALQALIAECLPYLDWPEDKLFEVKSDVSGWSIAYHLHHMAKAHGPLPSLIERMQSGRLGEEGLEQHPESLAIIHHGEIPKGWKSPEITTPPDDLSHALVLKDFRRMATATQRLEEKLDELEQIPRLFPHFYFGPLNALEWLRFMRLHTLHHLGIIKRIEVG